MFYCDRGSTRLEQNKKKRKRKVLPIAADNPINHLTQGMDASRIIVSTKPRIGSYEDRVKSAGVEINGLVIGHVYCRGVVAESSSRKVATDLVVKRFHCRAGEGRRALGYFIGRLGIEALQKKW